MLRLLGREGAQKRRRRRFVPPFPILLAFLLGGLLAAPSRAPGSGAEPPAAALLDGGEPRDEAIAAGEVRAYRVAVVAGAPRLVTVEQLGIDLVVEDRPPAGGGEPLAVDAPNRRWGPEFLLLEAAGEHRIEIRSGDAVVPPGRYRIRLRELAGAEPGDDRRRAAAAAMTRGGRGTADGTLAALRGSLAAYREAAAGWRALGDLALEAEALRDSAYLENGLGERQAAVDDAERALAIWRQLGDTRREAETLDRLGLWRLDLGEGGPARTAIAGALALWRQLGERYEEADALTDAGLVEQTSGALDAALAPYQEARAALHDLGAPRAEARALNNLGGTYDLQGEPDRALASYRQALELRRALRDRSGEAQTLVNIAKIQRTLGDWQTALDSYDQAWAILARFHDPDRKAVLLNNLGYLCYTLGEAERARLLFEQALELRRTAGDRRGAITSLSNLGLAWRGLGDLDRALALRRQALAEAEALGEPHLQALSRLQLAELEIESGDPAALAAVEAALRLVTQAGDRRAEALGLDLRGRALALASRPEEALAALGQALALRQSLRDRAGSAATLQELAAIERRLGRREEARAHAEAAIAAIEGLRGGLGSLRLRASFLATWHRAYTLLIDLLMDRHLAEPAGGYDRRALEVSERARARSLVDLLHDVRSGDQHGATDGLAARRRALAYQLGVKAEQQEQLALDAGSGKQAAALQQAIEELLAELDKVDAALRGQAEAAGGDTAEELRPLAAEAIAGQLEPGTLLLEIALGPERSYVWAVSSQGIRSAVLPGEREIERLARRFYDALSTFDPTAGAAPGDGLARLLLAPVWAEVKDARRLVVVPDSALGPVAWNALRVPLPGQGWRAGGRVPLLETKEVVEVASATTLAVNRRRLARRPAAALRAAIFADPVFAADDPRVGGAPAVRVAGAVEPLRGATRPALGAGLLSSGFARLPATRREAAAIAGLAPAGEVWQALDFAANREAVLSGELRRYRIVHFATHAVADTRNPELSGLVLSRVDAAGRPRGGFLRLPDLYELDLAADLVVLSGCRTALGREVSGEGLMGLTRGFAAAGVPRVVGSLWPVEDRATAEIMTRFYRAMWLGSASPAAALHAAQRGVRRDPRYRDPHFWAGFVHQGEWR